MDTTGVQEELAEARIDAARSGLVRWNAWKDSVGDRLGLKFSLEYNALVEGYANSADDDWELCKNLEVGWTSSQDKLFLDNFHVGFWHIDLREDAGVPEDWGAMFLQPSPSG